MKTRDEGDKKLLTDISIFGWHVVMVMGDEKGSGFGYSVGLYHSFGHPEIIIVGLNNELTHLLINNMGEDIKQGKVYSHGKFYPDILDNFECLMIEVDKEHYQEYAGYGLWYYQGDNFPLFQCVYPTVKGIYPWQKDWPENLKELQPILGSIE